MAGGSGLEQLSNPSTNAANHGVRTAEWGTPSSGPPFPSTAFYHSPLGSYQSTRDSGKITHLRYMLRPTSVLQSGYLLAGCPLSPSKDWRPGFSHAHRSGSIASGAVLCRTSPLSDSPNFA